jgi:hypothetical protein
MQRGEPTPLYYLSTDEDRQSVCALDAAHGKIAALATIAVATPRRALEWRRSCSRTLTRSILAPTRSRVSPRDLSVGHAGRDRRRDPDVHPLARAARVPALTPKSPVRPSWLEQMSLDRWYAISGDRPDLGLQPTPAGTRYLKDNDPASDPSLNPARTLREKVRRSWGREPKSAWRGLVGLSAITEAWNSAVYASRFGASGSMIVFGGGHNDYFGSDVHAFDLASREWRRISDGFVGGDAGDYGEGARYPDSVYPDGSPLPPHTYDYVQYDPLGNDYLLLKGQTELGKAVKTVAIPHLFNLDTLRWRRGPKHPTAILNSGGWTTWDPSRRVLWGHSGDDGGGNAFIGFYPDADNEDGTCGRWTDHFPNKLPGIANHNAMQIDPVRDIIVVSVHALDELNVLDPADPARAIAPLRSSGSKPRLRPFAALEYAPNIGRIVYFSPLDSGTVYTIAPSRKRDSGDGLCDEWIWRAHQPTAGTLMPIADAASHSRFGVSLSHVFGRFRIASLEGVDVGVLIRHVDSPVYACRLN